MPRVPDEGGLEIKGNVPPHIAALLRGQTTPDGGVNTRQAHRNRPEMSHGQGPIHNEQLEKIFQLLSAKTHHYEPVVLPSKGKFYDGTDGPTDGLVYIRPMTGEEEQILATPRYVKRGKAIDMIFQKCLQGNINPVKLLSVDRTYLLIYLRIISYTPNYEVEIKCPACGNKYAANIDLNALHVDECPDDFSVDSLEGVLPTSGLKFTYRLARGEDEQEINNYRERRAKQWGDSAVDDTLHYRTALLLNQIEGITDKSQIQQIAKRLPIADVSHIRNLVNTPPFGVDTDVEMLCPACYEEFTIDLPLESNFFFPRRKKSS
jgi:hypothetical protein